jgi:hypothetical protein
MQTESEFLSVWHGDDASLLDVASPHFWRKP